MRTELAQRGKHPDSETQHTANTTLYKASRVNGSPGPQAADASVVVRRAAGCQPSWRGAGRERSGPGAGRSLQACRSSVTRMSGDNVGSFFNARFFARVATGFGALAASAALTRSIRSLTDLVLGWGRPNCHRWHVLRSHSAIVAVLDEIWLRSHSAIVAVLDEIWCLHKVYIH